MNKHPFFPGMRKNPYYIYAPNYRQSSAGVRALHYLCNFLNEYECEAYITAKVTCTDLRTPILNGRTLREHFLCGKNPIVIYPEIFSGNPLNGATIVRWLLNKPGHLGGEEAISSSELIFYFDPWVLPAGITGGHLRVPTLDTSIFHNNDNEYDQQRQGFCYYANKFLHFGGYIPEEIKHQSISLGQENILSHKDIAAHLRRAKALYCFEQSAIITEARACGCPVILVPSDYCPANEWTLPPGATLSTEPRLLSELQDELRTCFQGEVQEQLEFTKELVLQFIERTQNTARHTMTSATFSADAQNPSLLWRLPIADRHQHLNAFKQLYRPLYPDIDVYSSTTKNDGNPHVEHAPTAHDLAPWLARRQPSPGQLALMQDYLAGEERRQPFFQIFIIESNASPGALQATLESLERQLYKHFSAQRAVTLLQGIQSANADAASQQNVWLLFVHAGAVFLPSGLLLVALETRQAPDCRALYADELLPEDGGTIGHRLRPDFNLDMLLSCPADMARHWFFRSDVLHATSGFDPAFEDAAEFEWLLRLIEAGGIAGLCHVHEPLLIAESPALTTQAQEVRALQKHLRARGYDNATVDDALPGRYRILYGHAAQPLVSIIIPTQDQFPLLERCVSSLLENTAYPHYEILLVDNGSTDPAACAWLDGLAALDEARIRVLRYPQPFNYAAMNNLAAREARGDYLVLLNNDTAIMHSDWLDALLNHAQRPEVGVVGAKLLHPNGKVQHAGLVLGLKGLVGYPFTGSDAEAPGYMHRLQIDQNYSAVSASCLMVRRALYDELGGMDADAFPLICGDLDLCLRVRAAGYLIVWTPHAVVLHKESSSLRTVPPDTFARQRDSALHAMYQRWLPALANDPAYNSNLSLQSTEFAVETDARLNWNPLAWRPLPVVLALPADLAGCGHYRIIHPATALADAGLADARLSERHYSPIEIERLRPDAIILQRQVGELQIEQIRRNYQFRQTFKVAELDDYLPNVPMKSMHRSQMPQDIMRSLRRTVALADRLVVSTHALADALAGLHPDTRVVENRLPPTWWNDLTPSLRRQHRRPRVGWAGGSGHQGDLELILDIVKALATEVHWVFFGMCPEQMRPYVHELHNPVPIDRYAQKLASLNLDLALAPLEANLFNECKSNLRLLEYGACGYPVVCSDVRPYQGSLPVTRVKNRFKDWMDAIRLHTSDLDASAAAGDRLREAVRNNWMLEGAHLQDWLNAWLGH